MARHGGSRWREALTVLVSLGLAVVLCGVIGALVNESLSHAKWPTTAQVTRLLEFFLTVVVTVLVPLLAWGRRTRAVVAPTSESVARAKDVLTGLVGQQWRAEALLRFLDDPDPIAVRWRHADDDPAAEHAGDPPAASAEPGAADDQIAALVAEFRGMRRHRLVVLGGPGTGKTTLAVQLVLALSSSRQEDDPVPVLLSVAGWDTTAFPRLHEWLAARLERDYPALRAPEHGRHMPQILAQRGHILPVLDGLDELPAGARAQVITALNRSLSSGDQLILTSRTAAFTEAVDEAREVLHSAAVIEPEPVEPATAVGYLSRCLPPRPGPVWERILAGLATTSTPPFAALTQITSTPLGLWLLRAVYITPGADPTPLLDSDRFADAPALRAHLFDRLIEALIGTRDPSADPADLFRPRRRHDPDRVRRWLGYLAHHLAHPAGGDATAGRDFAWWRLARDAGVLTRGSALTVGLVLGLAYGLAVGIVLGLVEGLTTHGLRLPGGFAGGLVPGLLFGLEGGLVAGLVIGLRAPSWARQAPGFADLRTRGRLRRLTGLRGPALRVMLQAGLAVGIMAGLVAGLARGLVAGPASGLEAGLKRAPAFGLVFGLIGGLTYAMTAWAETPAHTGRASTPMSSWHADRALNVLRITTFALAAGIAFGLMNGLGYASTSGSTAGLASGLLGMLVGVLTFGPTVGLWPGEHHASLAYLIATCRLSRAGRLPRRLMPFLDDAHRLGLLHAVGPVYQFRHAELQDHLAATYHP